MSSFSTFFKLHGFLPLLLSVFVCTSCTGREKVVVESYPDGSPRKECYYKVKGETLEMIKEIFYYPGKQVKQIGEYKNGLRDGHWIFYYDNGNVWSEGYFKEGKSHGKRLTYFENGKLRYEAWYDLDRRIGIWKFYDETGKKLKEVDYSATNPQDQ
jgi:antitoxin component YwqK of YwqJK toxin-antitoxin module